MTTTIEKPAPAVASVRELVTPETFGKLVTRCMNEQYITRPYAERMIEQTLVFLVACARKERGVLFSPSKTIDPGWHAFVLHTDEYAEFCQRVAGRFLPHTPMMNDDIRSGAAMARTVEAMYATGYAVDEEFWKDAMSCGSGCKD